LNYRHAFHAGNFADVMKHAILLQILARRDQGAALTVLDTHAGAGLYDLHGEAAQRSGETALGVGRLMADPAAPVAFTPLIAAVRHANPCGGLRWYPGSPRLIQRALKAGDTYLGCELRADDHALLTQTAGSSAGREAVTVQFLHRDGYLEAKGQIERAAGLRLLLIDPPFERGDEYPAVLDILSRMQASPDIAAAVWTPIKDLQTFDQFLMGVEEAGHPDAVVAEVRLRPLDNPLKLNGCALILVNAPDVTQAASAICAWTARTAGAPGAMGQVCDLYGRRLIEL
jgi:23S rRNA (adenine2030-N6)-methyltransferase